jgi:hypothetical protein
MTDKRNKATDIFYFSKPAIFPQLYYVGYIGVIVSVVQFFTGNEPQAGVILIISIVILLLRPWSMLETQNKILREFFAFIPYGKIKFDQIISIKFTEGTVSQSFFSRGSSSDFKYVQYKIIMETDTDMIVLQVGGSKKKMVKKASKIASAEKVPFINFTA